MRLIRITIDNVLGFIASALNSCRMIVDESLLIGYYKEYCSHGRTVLVFSDIPSPSLFMFITTFVIYSYSSQSILTHLVCGAFSSFARVLRAFRVLRIGWICILRFLRFLFLGLRFRFAAAVAAIAARALCVVPEMDRVEVENSNLLCWSLRATYPAAGNKRRTTGRVYWCHRDTWRTSRSRAPAVGVWSHRWSRRRCTRQSRGSHKPGWSQWRAKSCRTEG